jgi:DNA-binding transcriptional MerR regulator
MGGIGPRAAARRLGVHENTVRNWADSGVLRVAAETPAGFRRFDEADVAALAEQLSARASARAARRAAAGEPLRRQVALLREQVALLERANDNLRAQLAAGKDGSPGGG